MKIILCHSTVVPYVGLLYGFNVLFDVWIALLIDIVHAMVSNYHKKHYKQAARTTKLWRLAYKNSIC